MYNTLQRLDSGKNIYQLIDISTDVANGLMLATLLYDSHHTTFLVNQNIIVNKDLIDNLAIYRHVPIGEVRDFQVKTDHYYWWLKEHGGGSFLCVAFDTVDFVSGFVSCFEWLGRDFRDYILGPPLLFDSSLSKQIEIYIEGFDIPSFEESLDMENVVDEHLYNPPVKVLELQNRDIRFRVVQDSVLVAGTKQRGLKFFERIILNGHNKFVSYGTTHGYGQVAMAYACHLIGLECHLFIEYLEQRTEMTMEAASFGAILHEIRPTEGHHRTTLLDLYNQAKQFADNDEDAMFVNLGLDDDNYIEELAEAIRRATVKISPPRRIWLAVGSGVILRALAKVFPKSEFMIVQVGKDIYSKILEGLRYKIFKSKIPFKEPTRNMPPYNALNNYDAKIWYFFDKYGKNDDLIWNVK